MTLNRQREPRRRWRLAPNPLLLTVMVLVHAYESALDYPSMVGMYPNGAALTGLHDLSGNIWEWTHSLFKPYPYDPKGGRNDPNAEGVRVLRGGSWFGYGRVERCAFRAGVIPGSFSDDIGFRVVVSLASSGF